MKKYEEFTQEISDLDASGLQKLLTKEIIKALEPKLVARQLLAEDAKLVGTGGHTRTFRKRTSVNAFAFAEGADIAAISPEIVYSTIDVKPSNFGAGETITGDAIDAADFNIINDTKEAIADAMARRADERCLFGTHSVTDFEGIVGVKVIEDISLSGTNWDGTINEKQLEYGMDRTGAFKKGLVKVMEVKFSNAVLTPGVDYQIDFYKGWIKMIPTPDAAMSGAQLSLKYEITDKQVVDVTSATVMDYNAIVDARGKIVAKQGQPTTLLIHPNEQVDLLKDEKFIDASRYGAREPILNGEIGLLAGLRVLVSTQQYQGVGLVVEKGARMGYYVIKKRLTTKVDKLEKKANDIFIGVWEKSFIGIINDDLIAVITNAQTEAYHKP